jgi:hypothetical protein
VTTLSRLHYLEQALRHTRDNLLTVGAPVFDQFASDVEMIRAEAQSIREDAKSIREDATRMATKKPQSRHKKAAPQGIA